MKRSTVTFFTICLVVLCSQSFAYYRSCNDAYCFTIPDQYGGSVVTLDLASGSCRNNGTTFAEINNTEIQRYVTQFINQAVGVGKLSRNPLLLNTQQYDNNSWFWVNGIDPGNVTVREQVGDYAKFGYLGRENGVPFIGASPPTQRRSFMCETHTFNRGCSFQFYGRCYITVYSLETWFSARNRCMMEWTADLASFDNLTDNAALMELDAILDWRTTDFWVGIRRTWWNWENSKTEVAYTNWKTGHPNNFNSKCICLSPETSEWLWVECNCDSNLSYQYFCLSGWQPKVDGSSHFVRSYDDLTFILLNLTDPWKSLFEAQRLCKAYDSQATLAEVKNVTIQNYLTLFLNESYQSQRIELNQVILNAFIYDPPAGWNWADGEPVRGIGVNGQNGPPIYLLRGYLRTSDFTIYVNFSTDRKGYICEYMQYPADNSTCCPGGFCFQERCYVAYNKQATWFEGRNDCLEKGGELASFKNITTDKELKSLNGPWLTPPSNYWINLKYRTWKWQDSGLIVKYTNWADGDPVDFRKECICLQRMYSSVDSWKWRQCNCSEKFQFVCMTANRLTPTTVKPGRVSTGVSSASRFTTNVILIAVITILCLGLPPLSIFPDFEYAANIQRKRKRDLA